MLAQDERDRVRVGLNIELRRQLEWIVGCDQRVGRGPSGPEHAATCGRRERSRPAPAGNRGRHRLSLARQCHPHPPRAGRHIARRVAERDRARDAIRVRVDADQRAAQAVDDPDRAGPDRDPAGAGADGDRPGDDVVAGVDAP